MVKLKFQRYELEEVIFRACWNTLLTHEFNTLQYIFEEITLANLHKIC